MSNTCLVPLEVFRQSRPQLYEAHKKYFDLMSAEWDSDYVILDLLSAIFVFNPEWRYLVDTQNIRLKQHIYKYLLQRYLLLKYRTEEKAKDKYRKLLSCIELGRILMKRGGETAAEENCDLLISDQIIHSSGIC